MKSFFWVLLLAGCMVGPDYFVPEGCLPEQYEESSLGSETRVDLGVWWQQCKDHFLEELIEEALCHNFDFLIALRKIEEMRAQFKIEKSPLYPQIAADAGAIRSRRSSSIFSEPIEDEASLLTPTDTNFAGPFIQNFYQVGLDATWELDLWGKNRRRAEFGLQQYQASQESALDMRISLIAEVVRAYAAIRSLQQQIVVAKDQIERQKELLYLAEALYDAGLTSHADVVQAKALLDQQQGELPFLERDLKDSIFTLAGFLGRYPEGFETYFQEGGAIPATELPQAMPSELLRRRPDIRLAERELAAATSRIGIAKAEFFPSFSLISNFGVQSNFSDLLFTWPSRFWTVGTSMIWNLFTGGKLIGQLRVETERQKQALLRYEKSIQNALIDVEIALSGFLKQKDRLFYLEKQLEDEQLLHVYALDQYRAGLIAFSDALVVEKKLFETQVLQIIAEETRAIFLIGLYKALGGGWECSE